MSSSNPRRPGYWRSNAFACRSHFARRQQPPRDSRYRPPHGSVFQAVGIHRHRVGARCGTDWRATRGALCRQQHGETPFGHRRARASRVRRATTSAAQTRTSVDAPARSFNGALLRRDHRDLDQHVGGRKLGLDTGARPAVVRIDPGKPGLVHLIARADVGEPDLRGTILDLWLPASASSASILPRISSSAPDRGRTLVGDGAGDVDHTVRFDGAGKDFCGLVTDDVI